MESFSTPHSTAITWCVMWWFSMCVGVIITHSIYQRRQPQNSQWWGIIPRQRWLRQRTACPCRRESISGQPECVCVYVMKSVWAWGGMVGWMVGQLETNAQISKHKALSSVLSDTLASLFHVLSGLPTYIISLWRDGVAFPHCCDLDHISIWRWRMMVIVSHKQLSRYIMTIRFYVYNIVRH